MQQKTIQQKVEVELPEALDITSLINESFEFLKTQNLGFNTECVVEKEADNKYGITLVSTLPICFSGCKQYLSLRFKKIKASTKWSKLKIIK